MLFVTKLQEQWENFIKLEWTIFLWSVFSHDLNQIESLWNAVKDHIAMRYREEGSGSSGSERRRQISPERLPDIIPKAWKRITLNEILNLINSMPSECRAVINTNGGHILFWRYNFDHIGNLFIFSNNRNADTNFIRFVIHKLFNSKIRVWCFEPREFDSLHRICNYFPQMIFPYKPRFINDK